MPRGPRRQLSHASQSLEAQETQRTIIRTASQLFLEHGYRAVSTRQIAETCGLTQPALYHYFADKQDLYVAVMREELAESRAALERIVRRNESVPERLKRVVRYLLSTTQHDLGMMFHDINKELSIEAQRVLTEEHRVSMIAPIATIFEEGIQQGVLRAPHHGGLDAQLATYLFLSMLSKFLMNMQSHAVHDEILESNHAETIVNVLLHGLALPDSQDARRQEGVTCEEDTQKE